MTGHTDGEPSHPDAGEAATFDALARAVQARFDADLAASERLFEVEAPDLGSVFLDGLPAERRPHHNCSRCLTFLRRFGRLATVTKNGGGASALWKPDAAPPFYRPAVAAMADVVSRGRIRSPFLASGEIWGTPRAGGFAHFALTVPEAHRYAGVVLDARQAMAARREDFRTLSHALDVFDRRTVAQALTLLRAEALYRSEKVIGPAEFLLRLHDEVPRRAGARRDAILWRAVAAAPPGFCTPRGAMIGTLLEDIAAGLDFATVKARFDAEMHPLRYRRPHAAPRAGNIAQAERLFAHLGLEPALPRRYARLDEVPTVWRPACAARVPVPAGQRMHNPIGFDALTPRERAQVEAATPEAAAAMSWRYEAANTLSWALGREAAEIGHSDRMIDVAALWQDVADLARPGSPGEALRLRPVGEILDALARAWREHWIVRQARQKDMPLDGLNGDVVAERHVALNRLTGFQNDLGTAWDEIDKPT